uniref:CCHC-type domain-containing protein n=1 Tax=Anopheles dirus TaxID=7168 RepID=A0A182N1P7_9DIPT
MWERPDATKQARIRIARTEAEALVQSPRLLVGNTSCRVEILPDLEKAKQRCFHCLERGHLAQRCSGADRTAMCVRCGSLEHRAKDCANELKCIRCGGNHRIAALGCGLRTADTQVVINAR